MSVTVALVQPKFSLTQGLATWSGRLALVGPVASEEGYFGFVFSIPLP